MYTLPECVAINSGPVPPLWAIQPWPYWFLNWEGDSDACNYILSFLGGFGHPKL